MGHSVVLWYGILGFTDVFTRPLFMCRVSSFAMGGGGRRTMGHSVVLWYGILGRVKVGS